MDHESYMREALELARQAAAEGEVPVGCVIADAQGTIVGRGRNRREQAADATAHAEIEAIRQAGEALGSWRLDGCTLYVTLEPCPMCAGAIINSRIPALVYGAADEISGSCGSVQGCPCFGAKSDEKCKKATCFWKTGRHFFAFWRVIRSFFWQNAEMCDSF